MREWQKTSREFKSLNELAKDEKGQNEALR